MNLSIELLPEEEVLLEQTAQRLGLSKSDLARQGIYELCQKLSREISSPYSLGEDLFDVGKLVTAPSDPIKKQVWVKLRAKHDLLNLELKSFAIFQPHPIITNQNYGIIEP